MTVSYQRPQAAFFNLPLCSTMPRRSLSFMITRSWPSIFTSVPDPLPNKDPVPSFHVERDQLALLIPRSGTRGDNLAFLRLLLCGVGNDDAAGGSLLGIDAAHEYAVVQRTEMHAHPP
jgi:hypothetical protein